jgi:hypothetical protein
MPDSVIGRTIIHNQNIEIRQRPPQPADHFADGFRLIVDRDNRQAAGRDRVTCGRSEYGVLRSWHEDELFRLPEKCNRMAPDTR